MSDNTSEKFDFQAEVGQVLHLVINSLYRNKEIFLRELISNASDALDKLRFVSVTRAGLIQTPPEIRVIPDKEAGTLTIWDSGIGMSREDLIKFLGTIAHSGTREFLKKARETGNVDLIGQFGVGFYSAYLVADRVEVTSRAAGTDEANIWSSDAQTGYEVASAERETHGTSIVLHLRDDQKEFLDGWKLRRLVQQYSDYVSFPIKLITRGDDEEEEAKDETINRAEALWQRSPSDITEDQYNEFYKHLTHDWDPALAHTHFKIEGSQQFQGLLFVPKRAPFDLFDRNVKHGVRLYVNRVFIMEDCEELLPTWLRFVRGVIDANDLPLNVSREFLQDSKVTRTIRKQVIKKVLDLLESLAADKPDDYATLWGLYGRVIKEAVHFDPDQNERVAKLLRYESSGAEGLTNLADYVSRMKEEQSAIYYALGHSREAIDRGPYMEALRKRGYEVLYLLDPVDQFTIDGLREFDGKPFVSAMQEDLQLPQKEEEKKDLEEKAEQLKDFTEFVSDVLGSRVRDVRATDRLVDTPACLVIPEGGLNAQIERLLRANMQKVPENPRVFELNPSHPIIVDLKRIHAATPDSADLREWVETLYDQALLTEGSPIENPAVFASRLTRLMQRAISG